MNDITIHMTVQDRIPCFFFVFSASFPWSPWPILSANSSKSPPKRCVISNRFYLSPLTQTTLLSHLCYPESFLMSSCWPFTVFSPFLPAPQPSVRSSKLTRFSRLPFMELFCCHQAPCDLASFLPSSEATLVTHCAHNPWLLPVPVNSFLP